MLWCRRNEGPERCGWESQLSSLTGDLMVSILSPGDFHPLEHPRKGCKGMSSGAALSTGLGA